jgi:transposase-like protein
MSDHISSADERTFDTSQEGAMSENVRKCPSSADRLNSVATSELSEKQKTAIELLLIGKSLAATARALDIDARTLYRWRQDEFFRDILEDRRRELWSDASGRLAALVHPSLDVMEQHLADRYDRARFRAASAILKLANLKATADERR